MAKIHHPNLKEVELSDVLYALGDPIRLGIVANLTTKSANSCVGACDQMELSKSTLSHHFKILRDAGIVYSEKDGKSYVNTIREKELNERFPGLLASILKAACRKKK